MTTDDRTEAEIVDRLVTRWHLSVPERAALPGGRARGSAVAAAIVRRLTADGWFPRDWRPGDDFDGGVIERTEAGCRIHWKAEAGLFRYEPQGATEYADPAEAARAWVRRMFGDTIDGVGIDWGA